MIRRWAWNWLMLSAVPLLALLAASRARRSGDMPGTGYAKAYGVRLASDWPIYPGESDECNNRGRSELEGTLRRVSDDRYVGRFVRASRLGFCGVHGRDQRTACGLQLQGRDTVAAEALAFDDGQGLELRIQWHSVSGAGSVAVEGTCSQPFQVAMARMYLGAMHEVEVPVAPAVIGRGEIRLGDYPWIAAITLLPARDSLDLPNSRRGAGR